MERKLSFYVHGAEDARYLVNEIGGVQFFAVKKVSSHAAVCRVKFVVQVIHGRHVAVRKVISLDEAACYSWDISIQTLRWCFDVEVTELLRCFYCTDYVQCSILQDLPCCEPCLYVLVRLAVPGYGV